MNRLFLTLLVSAAGLFSCSSSTVEVALNSNSIVAQKAQNELIEHLSIIYPNSEFVSKNSSKSTITLLLPEDLAATSLTNIELPSTNEGFKIVVEGEQLYIVGLTDKGVLNGVYSLLERMGYGFYISSDIPPASKKWVGVDENWAMEDETVVDSRFLFNWHNFLSGCTGWNLDDWRRWIDSASKMRYNGVMVHAYGNNPMFSFDYMGETKQTGYINNTILGREWGNQHINDVRRMIGGDIFTEAVYGAAPSFALENEKVAAATSLMQNVFNYADSCGTDVIFALDMDTWMSNPQNIIKKMDRESLFEIGGFLTPNPEHPEGYKYYKNQLESFVNTYPQVDELTIWSRTPSLKVNPALGSIWMMFTYDKFPASWKKEYNDILELNKSWLKNDARSQSSFAYSKLVKAMCKAREEIGCDMKIGYGTWSCDVIKILDVFMPKDVPFRPLNLSVDLDVQAEYGKFTDVTSHRDIYPIIWANHDDYAYLGRPFVPFDNLTNTLENNGINGLGIIHWTTHPLDLYFSSTSKQLWRESANIEYEKVINQFIIDRFGESSPELLDYYKEWATNGPIFGRETSDHVVDLTTKMFWRYTFDSWLAQIEPAKKRIEMLDKVDEKLQNNYWKYQRAMEQFYILFFENQSAFRRAFTILEEGGDIAKARLLIKNCSAEKTIEKFVEAMKYIDYTSGEEALVISLNCRWMTDFFNLKQRVGLDDVRVRFAPTMHDLLAQMPGCNTYHIDSKGDWNIVWWDYELPENNFKIIANKGAAVDPKKVSIPLATIHKDKIAAGSYTLSVECNNLNDGLLSILEDGEVIAKVKCEDGSAKLPFTCKNGKLSFSLTGSNVELYSFVLAPTLY